MKTFFLCWDNTNFKLYLIRTNLNCPLSPPAKFLHFQNGFLFVWKNPLQPAAIHDPILNLALIQICNSICEESTKKDGEKKKLLPENFCRYSKLLNKKLVCMKCILLSSLTKPLENQPERASFQCNYLTEKNILPPTQNYVKAKWPWSKITVFLEVVQPSAFVGMHNSLD